MTHGKPDDGITAAARTTHQLDDLGEHAVRTGAIVAYDRRGDVFYFDDFEITRLRYEFVAPDTDALIDYSTDHAKSGLRSLRLVSGSDGPQRTYAEVHTPGVAPSRIGIEVSFDAIWIE